MSNLKNLLQQRKDRMEKIIKKYRESKERYEDKVLKNDLIREKMLEEEAMLKDEIPSLVQPDPAFFNWDCVEYAKLKIETEVIERLMKESEM